MSDLKSFWDNEEEKELQITGQKEFVEYYKEALGLFFWERGGKQFVLKFQKEAFENAFYSHIFFENYFNVANKTVNLKSGFSIDANRIIEAQDFLDCLACLGEDKVKELIKELEGVENHE